MTNYAISGVWKDGGEITHYAFHVFINPYTIGKAVKKTKTEAVNLLDNTVNSAVTVLWNYTNPEWRIGTEVKVVGTAPNKYLRTNQDGTVRDNLAHLIDYGLVF